MNNSSWSYLPKDLLEEVATYLETRPDFLNFRAVCKSWEDAAPRCLLGSNHILHHTFPQMMEPYLCTSSSSQEKGHKPPMLFPTSVCLLRPLDNPTKRPWLAFVEEINSGKLRISNEIHPIDPRYKILGGTIVNLSRLHVSVLYQGIKLRTESLKCTNVTPAVLFVNPAVQNSSIPKNEDCTAILIDYESGALFAYRLRHDGKHAVEKPNYWFNQTAVFTDLVNFKGQVYAIDDWGRLYAINYRSLDVRIINFASDKKSSYIWEKRLIASSDDFYMVSYRDDPTKLEQHIIKMYKIGDKLQGWKRVSNLGDDKVLIMTNGDCFFVSVNDFPGWEGNCIIWFRNKSIFKYYFEESGSRKEFKACVENITSDSNYSHVFRRRPQWLPIQKVGRY